MHLEANAVSQAMAEAIAMTGCGNQLASNAVEGLPANPGGNGVERCGLRRPHRLVDVAGALAWLANSEGARAIRAVAVQLRAHVEDDQLAAADLALAGLGVRQGAVWAGGDDRREGGVAALLADPGFGGAGHVALRTAAQPSLQAPAPNIVSELGRRRDRRQLALVLDPTQALDRAASRNRLGPVGQFPPQALEQAHREVVVLKAEAARKVGGNTAEPVVGDGDRLPTLDLSGGALGVAEVGEEEAGVGTADTGAVGAGETGQVRDVDQLGDQHQVELTLDQRGREPVAAGLHCEAETPRWRARAARASL